MLLFHTLLNISPEMSEEDFIHLIIEWCATSQYEENRIRDLSWNGEKEIRWGDDHPLKTAFRLHERAPAFARRQRKSGTAGGTALSYHNSPGQSITPAAFEPDGLRRISAAQIRPRPAVVP